MITNDLEKVLALHYKHGLENTEEYIDYMSALHYSKEDILKYIEETFKGGNNND